MTWTLRTLATLLVLAGLATAQIDPPEDSWGCEADWAEWGTGQLQHLGADVASGGDWNGDGFDDMLVSSLSNPEDMVIDRRVALYLGGTVGGGAGHPVLRTDRAGCGFAVSVRDIPR